MDVIKVENENLPIWSFKDQKGIIYLRDFDRSAPTGNVCVQLELSTITEGRLVCHKLLSGRSPAELSRWTQRISGNNARDVARCIDRNCLHCVRYRPKLFQQVMRNLPVEQIPPSRLFSRSGIDFCGPISTYLRIRGPYLSRQIRVLRHNDSTHRGGKGFVNSYNLRSIEAHDIEAMPTN